jgi:hypothetical protein
MVLHIHLPSGDTVDCLAGTARLTCQDGSLAVERPASRNVLYATAAEAQLTVGNGLEERHFHMRVVSAKLTPVDWSFLVQDVTEVKSRSDSSTASDFGHQPSI